MAKAVESSVEKIEGGGIWNEKGNPRNRKTPRSDPKDFFEILSEETKENESLSPLESLCLVVCSLADYATDIYTRSIIN